MKFAKNSIEKQIHRFIFWRENRMSKEDERKIIGAIETIDQAVDVSRETIKVSIEDKEDNPLSWVMLGILTQLDIIRQSTNIVDDIAW